MSTVDLVGPKGYVHGWRYVGGPGLPSVEPGRKTGGIDLGGHKPESAEGRRRALAAGHALPPAHPGGQPGFPITDAKHWEKARDAVGRSGGGARRRSLAKLLKKTAPEFGKSIKGTWIEQELSGASMSNTLNFASSFIPNPSKAQWAAIDARRGGGGDEKGADQHISAAKTAFSSGQHGAALDHLQQAHAMTSDPAKKSQIESLHKNLAGTALQAGTIKAMSNRRAGVEYDLASRYRALNFADDGDNDIDDMRSRGKLECPNCGYRSDNADFQIKDGSSGTSDAGKPDALRTPGGGGEQSATGFSPGSAGLNVASKGGSYMGHSNGAGRGIELARRQVTSAADIVVSRAAGGAAVIRHRRGGEKIATIQRLADGTWGGQIEGGPQLDPRNHQRAVLQDAILGWNKGQVTPFRPAMPLQQAPAQTELMNQFGVTNVRALATPTNGSSDGARTTGSDSGDGPAGLSPKGVTIYKKLIAKKFPPARALAFARRAENFGQKAS